MSDPTKLPPDIRVKHTESTLCIFDKFPKAMYHLLVLPRIADPLALKNFVSLRTLLGLDKQFAKNSLLMLKNESKFAISMIEDEMVKSHGFKWNIWVGFHGSPSMDLLHLHIISSDLCSDSLKNKKHYNSFHPSLGFFLHLDDVLSWFDLTEAEFRKRASLEPNRFETLLRGDLRSWRTGVTFQTIPLLKASLKKEWEKEKHDASRVPKRKRGDSEDKEHHGSAEDSTTKKRTIDTGANDA
ncbi:HIT-like domain-containing protein [Cantharellus anzutake]|uniref:HIT-like domain-containing protein n=1 Tax=Cantharellus anzutake TaxID=1750568 RepID=UPI0019058FE5|nr:HIT-like domain-containing protein [Cantharellus anzutake]KAF8333956.1 HIT-like domain-containing protein [Cantharellus anzutake]